MSMSRKDFEAISKAVKLATSTLRDHSFDPGSGRAALLWLAQDLAFHFRTCNPAFDSQRFLAACGVAE